ncbi:MAG: class I SAM-dependent rRNA methyltransferase [Opitutales bacterium]
MAKELPFLKLGSRQARVLAGHPWVFGNELAAAPDPALDGLAAELLDARGRSLGSGIVNSRSQIVWRRYSRERRAFDEAFLHEALRAALDRRNEDPVQRLAWSEADRMPGLVVDRYGDVLCVQALTLAVDQRLEAITRLLRELLPGIREVVYRNDAPTREKEGLPRETRTDSGERLAPFWQEIDGVRYELDLQHAHKTGFYLDQRAQQRKVGSLAQGRRVLDAFCNAGAFGLQAALRGADEVLAIDSVEDCIRQTHRNAVENKLPIAAESANVFDWFRANPSERFDLIVLDPPSFAPNRKALDGALRGYKELNLRALKALNIGGILATYSCSQAVTAEIFRGAVRDAATDARCDVRVLEEVTQPADHPEVLTFPESAYLHGLILAKD